MRLYGTITSERATKGQGGNWIDIQLSGKDKQELGVIAFRHNEEKDLYYCSYLHEGTIKSIFQIKGKRQKGENHYGQHIDESGNAYCLQCKKFE